MSDSDDIVAIKQLLARYNTAADLGDGEAFSATFTEDGVVARADRTTSGRAALTKVGGSVAQRIPGIRHWVDNHVVTLNGDEATATVYVLVVVSGGADGPTVMGSGRYLDQLRRTPHGWRFTRREYVADV